MTSDVKRFWIVCLLEILLMASPACPLEPGPASALMRRCEALLCAEKERLGLCLLYTSDAADEL